MTKANYTQETVQAAMPYYKELSRYLRGDNEGHYEKSNESTGYVKI
jgi:hypothetical protein